MYINILSYKREKYTVKFIPPTMNDIIASKGFNFIYLMLFCTLFLLENSRWQMAEKNGFYNSQIFLLLS